MKKLFFTLLGNMSVVAAFGFGRGINDVPVPYNFPLPQNTYHQYCKNIYSQNGEDGLLEQLLKELEITQGTFCEFGAYDGIASSNTYNLIKNYDFSGIAIEANFAKYQVCAQNYRNFKKVRVFHGKVLYNDANNDLDAWLERGNLAPDFDVLSIDIDGDDYYVWQNLKRFYPKIVILEVNPYRDPVFDELPGKPCSEYAVDPLKTWESGRVAQGCSFMAAVKLGLAKGYVPVSFTGNLIFVRADLVGKLKQFPYILSDNPYDYLRLYTHLSLWGNRWMTNSCLILNTAVRDYYLSFEKKYIDTSWLSERMNQIMLNHNVIF